MSKAAEAVGSADYLGMSDEDFLKVNGPEAATAAVVTEKTEEEKAAEAAAAEAAAAEAANEEPIEKTAEEIAAEEKATQDAADQAAADAALANDPAAQAAAVAAAAGDPDKSKTNAEKAKEKKDKDAKDAADAAAKAEADKGKTPEQIAAEAAEAARIAAGGKPKTDAEKEAEAKAIADAAAAAKPTDYKAFHDLVMKPFKANGKTIELKNPEEAIRLMQMGAGLGRKLQTIQPHLKVVKMLEKNDLLDPEKLSFLIDINSKNPDAIKKLIKDAGIDPLDLNIGDNVSYTPKNHSVTDQEMSFSDALSDIQSHESGQETLKEIDQKWDNESKALLFKEPALLTVIQSQRDDGTYAKITAEIDRQKILGTIPHSTPFLKAYQLAGDKLFPRTQQAPQIQTQPGVTQQPQVIATRVEAPKATVKNSAQAAAAAAPKTTSTRKQAPINPLAMADDDFMKTFSGRL